MNTDPSPTPRTAKHSWMRATHPHLCAVVNELEQTERELTAAQAEVERLRRERDEGVEHWHGLYQQAMDAMQKVSGELYSLRAASEGWLKQGEELRLALGAERWDELTDLIPHAQSLRAERDAARAEVERLTAELNALKQDNRIKTLLTIWESIPDESPIHDKMEMFVSRLGEAIVAERDSLRAQLATLTENLIEMEHSRDASRAGETKLSHKNGELFQQVQSLTRERDEARKQKDVAAAALVEGSSSLIAERDALITRLEALGPFIKHSSTCRAAWSLMPYSSCTCGLSALLETK